MKVLSYNVNGIRAALNKGFAEWLKVSQADVICIQEIKALKEQVDTKVLEDLGYHHFWFSAQKKATVESLFFLKSNPTRLNTGLESIIWILRGELFVLILIKFP